MSSYTNESPIFSVLTSAEGVTGVVVAMVVVAGASGGISEVDGCGGSMCIVAYLLGAIAPMAATTPTITISMIMLCKYVFLIPI